MALEICARYVDWFVETLVDGQAVLAPRIADGRDIVRIDGAIEDMHRTAEVYGRRVHGAASFP